MALASILVKHGTVITLDPRRRIIRDGAVLVENGLITQVGSSKDVTSKSRAEFEMDADGRAVLPGFVDTHVHLAQAMIRGCADDTSLIEWLQKFVWPLQGNFDSRDGKASAELCMLEMIKSGTTTFLESLLHSRYGFDGIAETVERSGMRGFLSKTVMSLPGYGSEKSIMHPGMVEDGETCLREVETYFKHWNGKADGRIHVWYGARSLGGCTPQLYTQIAEGAKRLGTGVTMHLSEVQEDVRYARKEFGKMPAEFMDQIGLVGPQVVFAHGVWLTEDEWAILARKGAHVAHCPSSNMKLSSGFASVPEMTRSGVNVGLGCDGGPSNNCYDMIREMKTASLLQKVRTMNPLTMSAQTVIEMATINGARALGLESQVGSIEVGKKADLIVVNMRKPHLTPTFNPVSSIVYAAEGSDVESSIIDGKIIMENRIVKTLDEEKIVRVASERALELLERTGLTIAPQLRPCELDNSHSLVSG
jgi:cytosine/adenosine deaminase-related metal-dependent hydrolase